MTYFTRGKKNNFFLAAILLCAGMALTHRASAQCNALNTFPYLESFSSSGIPACWAVTNSSSSYYWTGTAADGTHGVSGPEAGSGFLTLDVWDAPTSGNVYKLTSPRVALGTTPKLLSYYYYLGNGGYTGTSPSPLTVQISIDSGLTWTNIYVHSTANSTFASSNALSNWHQNVIDLTAYANDTIMIRFAANSNYGGGYCNMGLDEFSIYNAPTCFPPTGLAISTSSFTTAHFSWVAPVHGASGYNWEIRTSGAGGSGPTGLVASGSNTNTADSTSLLAASTTYTLYVQSDCGVANGTSSWAASSTFTTPCAPIALPIIQGFNGTSIPGCWTQQYVTGTSNLQYVASTASNPATTPQEGTDFVYWNSYSISSGNETRLVSPQIITTGISSVDVNFYWFAEHSTSYNSGNYLNEGVKVQYSLDGVTWTTVQFIPRYDGTLASGAHQWVQKNITLPAAAGNQPFIYVGFSFVSADGDNCSFDNLNIFQTPACSAAPLSLSTPTVGGLFATVGWAAPAQGATEYNWEVRNSGAGGSGATGLVVSDSTSQTLDTATGLTPLTTYYLYVQQSCGSAWAGPYAFTTTYAPCAGAPTAGTGTLLSAGVCSATLTLAGTTTGASAITYQWQSSPPGLGIWTNVAAATTDTAVILLDSVTTDFRCVVVCGNSGLSDTSSVVTVTASPGTVGGFSPVAVTGFNQDVIANGNNNHSANPPALSTTTTVDAPNGYYFYDASYSYNGTTFPATSLPVNGQVVSSSITGLLYQLQSATASNVLQLRGGGAAGTSLTGTLTLTTPQSGTEIYLLGVSGNGASTITAVVHFDDGSSQTFTNITVKDWFNGTPYSQGGFGRVSSSGFDAGAPGGNNPRMYDLPLVLSPTNYNKLVDSITVTNTTPGAVAGSYIVNIFAVTMATPTPAAFCGGLATSVSLFNAASSGVNYQWQSSTTSGGPYANVTTGSGATGTTYTNTSTGSIYYVVQGTCAATGLTALSNQVNININPSVSITASPTTVNYCSGGAGVTISAIASQGGLTYSWSPAAGLSSTRDSSVVATPSASTTYTVAAFNAGGCSSTATVVVNYVMAPSVSEITASPSSICAGNSSELIVTAYEPTPSSFCIPSISYPYDDYMATFTLTNITNTTTYLSSTLYGPTYSTNNYADHGSSSSQANLPAGQSISLYAQTGSYDEGAAVWIDYNHDGVFANNELVYAAYSGSGYGNSYTDTFVVPTTAINGPTKMRVRTGYLSDTLPDPNTGLYACAPGYNDFGDTYGATDDYTVNISGATNPAPLTYSWSPAGTLTGATSDTAVATPANGVTLYSVTISNGICSVVDSVYDTVGVALAIAPTATTTSTGVLCSGSTTFLLNSNRTGGGSPFRYSWTSVPAGFTSSAASATVTPDTTTTYYLTVTDTCGSTVTDSVTATVVQTPVVSASALSSLYCTGGTAVTLTAAGATTYSWNNSGSLSSSTGDTVYASPSGTTIYTVTGTTAGCSATATATVSVSPSPVISLDTATPPSPSICAGHQSQLEVDASVPYTYCIPSITNTYLHYLGSFSLTDTTNSTTYVSTSNGFSPGTSNNYVDHGVAATTGSLTAGTTYDFSGTCGGAYEGAAIWIDFNQNGVFDNNELLYAHYVGAASGGAQFTGSFQIPATAFSGTTKMRVRIGWGSDTLAGPTGVYACAPGNTDGFSTYGETDDYTITITGGATPTGLQYSWTPANTVSNASIANPVATPSATTAYTVVVTDPNTGCTATTTDTVTIATPIPLADTISGPTITICAGVTSVLTATATGGCAPYHYSWSAGNGVLTNATDSISPITTTTYTLVVTDSSGNQVTSTFTVNVFNPQVTATTAATVCGVPATVVLTATPAAGSTILWYDSISGGTLLATGDTFRPVVDSTTTFYAFATTSSPVCTSIPGTPVVATAHQVPALALNANIVYTCSGTAQPLTITSALPAHGSYVWTPTTALYTNAAGTTAYTGGNASSLYGLPATSTAYTISLYDSSTGCSATARDSFHVYPRPTANLTGADTTICPGAILSESVTFTGTAPWVFNRTTDQGSTIVTVNTSTNPYTFADTPTVSGPIRITTLSDGHCSARYSDLDSINVTIDPISASFTESTSYQNPGTNVTFTNTSNGAVSYSWTFGDGGTATTASPVHSYANLGTYTVTLTVINANGCSSTTTLKDTVAYPLGIKDASSDDANLNIYSFENRVTVDFSQFQNVDASIQIYNVLGQEISSDQYHNSDKYVKALDLEAAYVIVRVRMADGSIASKKLFIHK